MVHQERVQGPTNWWPKRVIFFATDFLMPKKSGTMMGLLGGVNPEVRIRLKGRD